MAASLAAGTLSALAQNAVTTFAGSGSAGSADGTGTAASFQFGNPSGVAVDASGNLYIADALNHKIRKITPAGVVSTHAGTGSSGSSDHATTPTLATFNRPQGIAIDGAGNLYVADANNHTIRRITSAGVVTTLAGTAGSSGTLDGTGAAARFNTPLGIAADRAGSGGAAVNVYVADTQNHTIRRIVVATGVVTTLAGTAGNSGTANGTGAVALLNHPDGIASNTGGTQLFVADTFNHTIRQIAVGATAATSTVTTLAGTAGTSGATDAVGTAATFNNPQGLALDATETNVLVADTFSQLIRSVVISSGTVTTIAGQANTSGSTDGLSTAARFNFPSAIVRDVSTSSTYVIDTNNQRVRRITTATAPSITTQPSSATVATNGTTSFTVAATGNPAPTYQWQIQPAGGSTFSNITASANYSGVTSATLTLTGVTSGMNGDKFQVLINNNVGSTVTSSTATLTVTQPPVITSSASATFTAGQSATFTVTATGSPSPTFSTGVLPGFVGFNTSTGVLSVNPSPSDASTTPYSITITATNSAGNNSQTFSLTVLPPNSAPVITTQPVNYTVVSGQTTVSNAFSVTATGNPAISSYQWQKRQSDLSFSNLTNDGIYSNVTTNSLSISSISPAMNGDVFRVLISNSSGTTTSSEATLFVAQSPAFTGSTSTTFVVAQNNSFTITTSGTPAPTISLSSGTLPSSVTLVNGVLSGFPSSTEVGQYSLTFTATNSSGSSVQSFVLNVSMAQAAASISTHPASVSANLGATITFTASATGTPTPTLRWRRQPNGTFGFVDLFDDGTYSGTTTGTLTINSVTAGMSGDQFALVATNIVDGTTNTATTNTATLTVNIGTTISTFAGSPGFSGNNDGTGTNARFSTPAGIAVDSSGNFYVADSANHVIRKVSSSGVVTTLAGTAGSAGSTDGLGSAARFNGPSAITVSSLGTVYVADTYNHLIRAITADGSVTTVAGLAFTTGSADGTGSAARFSFPAGITIDSSLTIYVADSNNHTIRRISNGNVVTTVAGTAGTPGDANGNGSGARFRFPNGLVSTGGVLYVADSYNHTVRRVTSTGDVTTFAGSPGLAGSLDGNGLAARFNQPLGLAADSSGNLFVADTYSNTIRKISTGGDVTTIAGSPGVIGTTDGSGGNARFNQPFSLVVDSNSNLYILDTRNHAIRRSGTTSAPAITTQPENRTSAAGGSVTFTVVATGNPTPGYQWQRQPVSTGIFANLVNDGTYSGVTTASLTVSNIQSTQNGDQFRVIVSNGINPVATSNHVTLLFGEVPVITSGASATFKAGEAGAFTVTATGSPVPTFTATNLPSWLSISTATGVLSGTPPAGSEGTYTFTVSANNGAAATQTFTLTVTPATTAPAITAQPASATVDQGQAVVFNVTATGTGPLAYQWRRNGVVIVGATAGSLALTNVQASSAASYSVTVSNSVGSVTSSAAVLAVNTAPVIVGQPQSQLVLAGSSVTFSVDVSGGSNFSYQWRKNGVNIPGANAGTLTITSVNQSDAGNFDVQVTSGLGSVRSSVALLTVTTANAAPVITAQPAGRTVLAGTPAVLTVAASGAPAPSYQWRKDGAIIVGAVAPSYTVGSANAAGSYDVLVSNALGSVVSAPAVVRVLSRSYAGTYFGDFSGGLGRFALLVRDDNTGVFLGYLPGSTAPVMSLNLTVSDAGGFLFSQASVNSGDAVSVAGEPARGAALSAVSVSGTIGTDGTLSGSIIGGANGSLSAVRASDAGATQGVAGYYQAGSGSSAAVSYAIAGPSGQAFVIVQSGTATDGGLGSVTAAGSISVVTNRSVVAGSINAGSGTLTGTSSGGINASFSGGSESALALQRLVNISSRARVASGDNVAIAGFVISGEQSKPVLIRAVGPTLASAPFNVAGALASPRLELFRGQTSLRVNTGIAADRIAIDAAGAQAGAFTLGASGADAAILTTLAPGNYTAVVSSTTAAAGVALVEVYDLSGAAAGQKLLNIATRAFAGADENTLIAGFVVPAGPAKRVLVRGVGPGLTPFGVSGVVAQPTLRLLGGTGATVAQNTNWNSSADREAIAAGSAQVGAFGLANNDSALVVTLPAGNYTAQVVGAGGATGVALIEVYELP